MPARPAIAETTPAAAVFCPFFGSLVSFSLALRWNLAGLASVKVERATVATRAEFLNCMMKDLKRFVGGDGRG